MTFFSQKLNFLYNLALNFKDYLEKWDDTLTDGKKLLEEITNNFTELRYIQLLNLIFKRSQPKQKEKLSDSPLN